MPAGESKLHARVLKSVDDYGGIGDLPMSSRSLPVRELYSDTTMPLVQGSARASIGSSSIVQCVLHHASASEIVCTTNFGVTEG
jgi:hypothetical protein